MKMSLDAAVLMQTGYGDGSIRRSEKVANEEEAMKGTHLILGPLIVSCIFFLNICMVLLDIIKRSQ